jgi:hypothetical protein
MEAVGISPSVAVFGSHELELSLRVCRPRNHHDYQAVPYRVECDPLKDPITLAMTSPANEKLFGMLKPLSGQDLHHRPAACKAKATTSTEDAIV